MRAQAFGPAPGETVDWVQVTLTGDTLDAGVVEADAEGRVHLKRVHDLPRSTPNARAVPRPSGRSSHWPTPVVFLTLDAATQPVSMQTELRMTLARAVPGDPSRSLRGVLVR